VCNNASSNNGKTNLSMYRVLLSIDSEIVCGFLFFVRYNFVVVVVVVVCLFVVHHYYYYYS